eukprot:TRINITY_DN947_c0_g1_i12.p2 TRINITY_DN947_c0_g1~~TRINITY_DN947_c0_g1_i12.p2  ORF type:complete len:123 (-),score=16.82 TRINITY_DN947_c0_g1_i12:40-408(-)
MEPALVAEAAATNGQSVAAAATTLLADARGDSASRDAGVGAVADAAAAAVVPAVEAAPTRRRPRHAAAVGCPAPCLPAHPTDGPARPAAARRQRGRRGWTAPIDGVACEAGGIGGGRRRLPL